MKKLHIISVFLFFTIAIGMMAVATYAVENIDPDNDDSQFAYGENVGWLNFEPGGDGGDGAEVTNSAVTGRAWFENVGWVNLSPTYGGVLNDGNGNLSGYAWGENVGWINFGPILSGGVFINTDGTFDGWAWGENIGWIHFQNQAVPYVVKTAWTGLDNQPPVAQCLAVTVSADINCTANAFIDNGSYDPDNDPITMSQVPAGPYPLGATEVMLTVMDDKGASGMCSATVTVEDNEPPVITCPANVTLECPADTSAAANGSATATDNCGAVTITSSDSSAPGCGNTEVITRTWTATDGPGNTTSCEQIITVVDTTEPTITSAAATPDYVAINGTVVISAVVSDTCSNSTSAEYSIDGGATWTDTGIDLNSGAVSRIISVKVRAKDECGNVSSTTIDFFLPVYDPSAGFITGGGWINSPAGAYKPDTGLTGKANFGFVSKYKKGATTPTGSTEFVFHAAGMNFHSSVYQWLVVTGSNYARYKGEGAINGAGSYKFMIWAGDGAPDTFRIKLYTESAEVETIVYDNGFDQAIGGGSIVIHTGGGGNK